MTTETKKMLSWFYTRENFPIHIAENGPWMICRAGDGHCAAIPRDPTSGHLPCHYGDMAYVKQMAWLGRITMLPNSWEVAK